jgi:RNA polymerase sigma-70 factor (ECF subfamily)
VPEENGREGERALVAAILAGDESAFERLYRDVKPRLLRAAGHFLGHQDAGAEDAVHDALAAALPHLAEFRFESSLYTWLNRYVVNFCYRQLNKRKKLVLAETIQLEGWSSPLSPAAPQSLKNAIAGELEQLSPEHAQVLRLRDLEGRSYEETAQELGLAVGTVMSRLARARAVLKKRLEKRKAMYAAFWKNS